MKPSIRLYYHLRPAIPRLFRVMVRRKKAKKLLSIHKDSWPIYPQATAMPDGWDGWPNGKKFALVLVHDVETRQGYDCCLQLLEIERRLGFRSSFNFVPEGYRVGIDLVRKIQGLGFEVGVHGLKHDGMLFLSKGKFEKNAVKINHYLKSWNSVGFYSPSMICDLQKIGQLNILYDQSTFDIDPFEPEPFGVNRIFPFFVGQNELGTEYVELPYTLPQDHTLFIILVERGIETWKRKLDWIAKNGGMVLLKTHPDYMDINRSQAVWSKYPTSHYSDFLKYLDAKYQGQYWHALPKEVAEYWKMQSRKEPQ